MSNEMIPRTLTNASARGQHGRSALDILIDVLKEKTELGTASLVEAAALPELIEARAVAQGRDRGSNAE